MGSPAKYCNHFYGTYSSKNRGKGKGGELMASSRLPSKALASRYQTWSCEQWNVRTSRRPFDSSSFNLNLTLSCPGQHLLLAPYAYSCVCESPKIDSRTVACPRDTSSPHSRPPHRAAATKHCADAHKTSSNRAPIEHTVTFTESHTCLASSRTDLWSDAGPASCGPDKACGSRFFN